MVALQSVTGNFVVSTLMAFRGNDTIGGHFLTRTPEKQQKERYALCHSSSLNSNDTGLLKSTRTGNIMLTHFGLVSNADISLRWRHNDHAGVSNHQPHGCLLNRLFRRKSKKTSKLRVTGLCAGNSPGTGEFPAQMASYAENVSIWWRHHVSSIWLSSLACSAPAEPVMIYCQLDPGNKFEWNLNQDAYIFC